MSLPDGLERLALPRWTNGHENFTIELPRNESFRLRIPTGGSARDQYGQTTANFGWLIRHAIAQDVRLRALGNGWSFSDVAVTDGGLVDTKALRQRFALRASLVHPDYVAGGGEVGNLLFTECGLSMLGLHQTLEPAGRALRASGASNGQSVAGAISTGTHGGAFAVGAVHDSVVGLHVVTGPDRHVWLERASQPVANHRFTDWLGVTEVLRDDALFNAALVSFGAFGFIHGLLIEAEPRYLLEEHHLGAVPYDDRLKAAMTAQDFSGLADRLPYALDDPAHRPYHFEVVVNPHQFTPAQGPYVRLMYKIPYHPDYVRRATSDAGFMYGDNTLAVMQTVLDTLGRLGEHVVPELVNRLFPLVFKPGPPATGTIGETFVNTRFRGKAASAAIGIDSADVVAVLAEVLAQNQQTPFAGAVGLRFVKGTAATLGFTRFAKTCVLELDGVDSGTTRRFLERVWARLDAAGIAYTLHWGKINFHLTPERVRTMYGDEAVDNWLAARHHLLDAPTRRVFTNPFMQRCGLDKEPVIA